MIKPVRRDKTRRKLFQRYENKRLELLVTTRNRTLPKKIRLIANRHISRLPKDSSKTRIRNRCVITGRGHAIYRQFRLSRIQLRKLGGKGALPGLRKSSW